MREIYIKMLIEIAISVMVLTMILIFFQVLDFLCWAFISYVIYVYQVYSILFLSPQI